MPARLSAKPPNRAMLSTVMYKKLQLGIDNFLYFQEKSFVPCRTCGDLTPGEWAEHIDDGWPTVKKVSDSAATGCLNCRLLADCIKAFWGRTTDYNQKLIISERRDWEIPVKKNITLQLEERDEQGEIIGYSALVDLYAPPGTIGRIHPLEKATDICSSSASRTCFKLVTGWIKECVKNHPACHLASTPLPHRVLDVGLSCSWARAPRVYESHGEYAPYIALSHCWGPQGLQKTLKTEIATLADRINGIEWLSIPKTFQDAITVARRLHVQYLWIDALCIVQDDDLDWERESAKMGEIYQNAYLVLSASVAQDDQSGFLQDRESHVTKDVMLHSRLWWKPAQRVRVRQAVDRSGSNPISQRAWTFQERIVSRRILHYNTSELVWECKSAINTESSTLLHSGKPTDLDRYFQDKSRYSDMLSSSEKAFHYWYKIIVPQYTQRQLTRESDRLPALSAIATHIQTSTKDVYLAGIWRSQLLIGLAWFVSHYMIAYPSGASIYSPGKLPNVYRAPSWCWPSVEGRISFHIDKPDVVQSVKIVDVQCTVSMLNPMGAVSGGHITLCSRLIPAVLKLEKTTESNADVVVEYTLNLDETPGFHKLGRKTKIGTPTTPSITFRPDVLPLVEATGITAAGQQETTVARGRNLISSQCPALSGIVRCVLVSVLHCKGPDGRSLLLYDWRMLVLGLPDSFSGAYSRIGLVDFYTEIAEWPELENIESVRFTII